MSPKQLSTIQLPGDRALFEEGLHGMIALCSVNERPLQGLAGTLDWRFGGAISRQLESGFITGQVGECVYLPIRKQQNLYHLILAGTGSVTEAGKRNPVPQKVVELLSDNLRALKLERIGVSKKDFGGVEADFFDSHFGGISLWIVQ